MRIRTRNQEWADMGPSPVHSPRREYGEMVTERKSPDINHRYQRPKDDEAKARSLAWAGTSRKAA